MRWIRLALFTTVLGATLSSAAATPTGTPAADVDPQNVTDLIAAVEATYGNVTSLRADFTQVTRSSAMGQETRQRGRVQLKRPRKMRWDFTQPDGRIFVTDGKTMWVWSSADNQVIVSTDLGSGGGMTQLLDDLNQLDELFQVTLIDGTGAEKKSYVLDLVPRQKEASFKKLRLVVAKKKYTVEQVTLTDLFDNEVDLAFSQVKFNQDIPDNVFNFEVPQGAQVIRTDGM